MATTVDQAFQNVMLELNNPTQGVPLEQTVYDGTNYLRSNNIPEENIQSFWEQTGLGSEYRMQQNGVPPPSFEGGIQEEKKPQETIAGARTAVFRFASSISKLNGHEYAIMSPDYETQKFFEENPDYVLYGARIIHGSSTFSIPISVTARQDKGNDFVGSSFSDQYIINPKQAMTYETELVSKGGPINIPTSMSSCENEQDILDKFGEKLEFTSTFRGNQKKCINWRIDKNKDFGKFIASQWGDFEGCTPDESGCYTLDNTSATRMASKAIEMKQRRNFAPDVLNCKNFKMVVRPAFPNDRTLKNKGSELNNNQKKQTKVSHTNFGLRPSSNGLSSFSSKFKDMNNELQEENIWADQASIKANLTPSRSQNAVLDEANTERSAHVTAVLSYVDPFTIPDKVEQEGMEQQ